MFGPAKLICPLVLACLLATPATLEAQEARGRGARCKNPAGEEDEILYHGCISHTCTKAKGKTAIWVERADIDRCCFNEGRGHEMGEMIERHEHHHEGDNCTTTTVNCVNRHGVPAIEATFEYMACFQDILSNVDEKVQQIIHHIHSSSGSGNHEGHEEHADHRREIKSPNFPDPYDNYMNETWHHEVASDMKIKLTFQDFELEGGYCGDATTPSPARKSRDVSEKHYDSPSARCENYICPYDYVQVNHGNFEERFCGSDMPSPIISHGNTMTVTFISDHSITYPGFKALMEPVDHREIKSPNFPNHYDNYMNETWNLEVASDMKIELTFQHFELEGGYCNDARQNRDVSEKQYDSPSARCEDYRCFDYVQVNHGHFEERYCGSDIPSPIRSHGHTMTVTFITDGTITYPGFKASMEAVMEHH